MLLKWLVTVAILPKVICIFCYTPSLIVNTNYGFVQGFKMLSNNNTEYMAFEGIPYAQPPVGNLRFKDPEPVSSWKETIQANKSYVCMQYFHYTSPGNDFIRGEEDCLYLNIYVPFKKSTEPFDVIVFIHGGAYMFHHGQTYGPKFLMDYSQVIFVSMNYRLGPLGFMSTEDNNIAGNMGVKDQLLALKFIKENIHHFNGNPDSITLSGMSVGGASVQILTLSPLSKGLFHKAIMQSGNVLLSRVLTENNKEKAIKLSELVGCSNKNETEKMVDCLRTRPAREIVDAMKHLKPWILPFFPFGIVVDKWSPNPILPKHPFVLLNEKKVLDIPVIFSNVGSEGLYPVADLIGEPKYLEELKEKWDELAPLLLDYKDTSPKNELNSINQKTKNFYFGPTFGEGNAFIKPLIKMVSDRLFIYNTGQAAKLQSAAVKSNVYHYMYLYRGNNSNSVARMKANIDYGPSHTDDTLCVLSSNLDMRSTPEDTQMCVQLTEMWLSFAKNGVPSMSNTTTDWQPVTKLIDDDLTYLEIVNPEEKILKQDGDYGNISFWSSLSLLENENLV